MDPALRMVRETQQEEVAVEAGLLDAAVVEDREGLAPGPQALGHALGRMRAERDHLEFQPRPVDAFAGNVAVTMPGGTGRRVAGPRRSGRTRDGQRGPGLGLWCAAAEHHAEDLPQDDQAEQRCIDDEPASERRVRSAGFDPPPERAGAPREGRFEGVGRRTDA